ncbi:MAG: gamma-glutamyltransferase, partial [Saprospiraceae bacterium]|nr:gamma-glutamyltransferase [Saprospiraceae bacterium]
MLRTSSLFLLLLLFAQSASAQSGRIPAPARDGIVVSSHYLASQAGNDILTAGGNAVDAAIATAFALAVTLPSAGNIGGGGFMLYHGSDGEITSFNFREKAPLAATPDMFLNDQGEIRDNSNHQGPLSVGVPGTVAGLYLAHQRLGSLPWHQLLEPAIRLAEDGFPSTWAMQGFLKWLQAHRDEYPSTAQAFLKGGTMMYEPGEIWKQPDLAATLQRIQADGADGFYRGETARLFAEYMRQTGGMITEEDLKQYRAQELKPVHGTYRGHDVYAMAPPSSGGVVLVEMLNILEGFDLARLGHNSALYLHVLTEAMRRAYADRALHLGDPDFNPHMPVGRLTSKTYADSLRATIALFRASASDSARFSRRYLSAESEETTHFSVVDRDGNAVSLTYTLEQGFGSRMVVAGAGFLLNNEMGDFNPIPGRTTSTGLIGTPPNITAPEKRMLSSMTPTIVARDGRPLIVIGSMRRLSCDADIKSKCRFLRRASLVNTGRRDRSRTLWISFGSIPSRS